MSIPSESSLDVVALHGPISRNNVLDGGGQQVTVVGETGSEWRAIIEGIRRSTFGQFQL